MKDGRIVLTLLVAWCAANAAAATAQPDTLKNSLGSLHAAGFVGADTMAVPAAPAAVKADSSRAQSTTDTAGTLNAFANEVIAQPLDGGLDGRISRLFGFSPEPGSSWGAEDIMPLPGVSRKKASTGESKSFYATRGRGSLEIIIGYLTPTTLYAYLVSVDGQLLAAATSTREGATTVPLAEAQAGFQKELGFWIRQYETKHPKP